MPFPSSSSAPPFVLTRSLKSTTKDDQLFAAFPVEIRVEIFRHYIGELFPVDKTNAGPLLLLRVSRAWRNLVLHTPQLWSSFSLDVQRATVLHGQRLISALKYWLKQSRHVSLTFKLRYPVLDTVCTKLFQEILSASYRWRDATLHAPSASLLSLWEAKQDSFPALRSLSVETVGLSPFLIPDLGLNWAQLVTLDLFLITIPTLDDCLHILEQGVNLTACSLNAVCVLDTRDPQRVIVLPKMKDLELKLYNGDHISPSETSLHAFLDKLDCPALRSFGVSWNLIDHWTQPDKLFAFLNRIGAHLESLNLGYLPLTTPQIVQALKAVPFLRHLSLALSQADRENDYINNEFFRALEDTALVPRLQSVHLNCNGESFKNSSLLCFMASRWKYHGGGGQLEALDIVSPKRQAKYRPKRFQDLKEGKLDVRASLKSESSMLRVVAAYLNKDSYEMLCFMNSDFPSDIRSLLHL
ncbi:hypothetical protein MIND_00723700 [Mycena indigotica]|uniref:F-box domain-containing protein n=1 Tax=Mycena indigotica TaxID=2126181 RepID=A0A8H6SMK3_9AGAR|nr:uncharacterized protein MIND_00723700 [Mycena indigotica]KAF7301582.1 hypothetical protein MIND_00723700 [Mycena indigotica]